MSACALDEGETSENGEDGDSGGGTGAALFGSGGDSTGEEPFGSSGGTTSGGSNPGSGGEGNGSGAGPGSGGESTQGSGGFSSNRDDFLLGGESRCSSEFVVCESFESTSPGDLPSGWSLSGYGTRTVEVTDAASARGERSLAIDVESQGAIVGMLRLNDVGLLASAHFGRMFYRIEGPGVSEFIHFDVLEAVGPWMGHENGVRFASTGTGVGNQQSNWSWIYNVQPFGSGAGPEFGTEGDRSAHPVVDEWMCLEWEFDSSEQTATYYHDGSVIDYLVIDQEQSEIPVFSEIGVGFQKFQQTGALRVWLDEVALNTTRIGCNH